MISPLGLPISTSLPPRRVALIAVSIDAGIVYADNGPYIVVIMSRVPSSLEYLRPIMEALENVHSSM